MAEWLPDITIDETTVRELLARRAPSLLDGDPEICELARGWDNVVWSVGAMLVRLPVRAVGLPGVPRELWLLDRIRPLVPLPIPGPITRLDPTDAVSWGGFAYPELPGVEAAMIDPAAPERRAIGTELGTFLRVLHAPSTVAEVDPDRQLPVDPMARADMQSLVPRTRESLDRLTQLDTTAMPLHVRAVADAVLDAAAQLPPEIDEVLLHGDLHLRHLLVDPDTHAASGVIDWGDTCRGPRSVDLALYWGLLDAPARTAFIDAYGPVDEAMLLRSRAFAIFSAAMLVLSAADFDVPGLAVGCRRSLLRTLDFVD
jgi:aminoglycoside phosphotransferase (APT) family kinase protein